MTLALSTSNQMVLSTRISGLGHQSEFALVDDLDVPRVAWLVREPHATQASRTSEFVPAFGSGCVVVVVG